MPSYEELREKHIAEVMGLIPEHLERLSWSGERLRAEREARLGDLLRVARERSPWHAKRLAHLDPGGVPEADLRTIPTMTKDDLMSNWDEIVTDPRLNLKLVESHLEGLKSDAYLLDHFHPVASGGSSGVSGVFVYDWQAWTLGYIAQLRRYVHLQMTDPEVAAAPNVAAVVAAQHPTHMTAALAQTFQTTVVDTHRFGVTLPLKSIVEGLNSVQPGVLLAYASALPLLTREAGKGNLRISPRLVIATSEPLLPEIRAAATAAWGVPIGNMWGTSEGGIVGLGFGGEPGLLLNDDLLIIEPVDQDGRPVPPGVRSAKIYLTNLFNPALPLIRYELTDEITLIAAEGPDGSGYRWIEDIQGRLDDTFLYEGGLAVHPHVFRSALGRESNIIEYQVRQQDRGAAIAIRCAGEVDVPALQRRIAEGLLKLGFREPQVSIRPVGEIQRPSTGKLSRFVPLRAPGPARKRGD
jgi:phenylacetate-coenzyme A ligase PaaK-like adenylate-forming protein